jgi:hypothetical protein
MVTSMRSHAPAAGRLDSARWRRPELWLLAGLTALGAVLRFATIASQSFWLDEATTVHEVSLRFGAMIHSIRLNETTPPLYFAVAWVWSKLFGTGEAGLRSLSAIAGSALIPVTFLCGRELVSRWAGLVAAAFATVSPFMIWYSQEARSYALFALFCALSLLFWARSCKVQSTRDLALWAVFSALAVLTHFFAGFLIAAEAVWLLWVGRRRATMIACGIVAAVQVAMLPLAVGDTSHPVGWITAFPLSIRIKQVPVDFGLGTLYQSSLVTDGLLGAGLLAAIVVAILMVGGGVREQRGAAAAAGIAAVTLIVPPLLAAVGHDYVVPRNLIAAWVPLAIVLGAAATAPRARLAGGALALLVIGGFIYAGARIDGNPGYQRPDWRGVARALGAARGPRAIVAYAGGFAAQPLEVYLQRIPWSWTGQPVASAPVTVSELDLIGNVYQSPPKQLPAGLRLIGRHQVNHYLVVRFALSPSWSLAPPALMVRAATLLDPATGGGSLLIQR